MATLFKQKGSDNYWIRYTRNGRQVRKTTRTSDESQALLQLREVELVEAQRRASGTVSQELVKAILAQSVRPVGLAAILEARRKQVAPTTQGVYRSQDTRLLEWLKVHYPTAIMLSDLTRPIIREFLSHMAETQTPRTHNSYLRRLRSIGRFGVKDQYLVQDPTEGIAFLPVSGSRRRAFTEPELVALFRKTKGEVRLLAALGLYAGAMRLSDIVSLTWSNIDLPRSTIQWRMSKRRGKPMQIAIHPRLQTELEAGSRKREPNGPVLPTFFLRPNRASQAFHAALVRAHLCEDRRKDINKRYHLRRRALRTPPAPATTPSPAASAAPERSTRREKSALDFHSLRYNFVSILKQSGCPEAIARSIMGHASVEVSAIYTQIDPESERKWIMALPDIRPSRSTK